MEGNSMNESYMELVDEVTAVVVPFGLDLLGALAILVVGWIGANWARRMVTSALGRFKNLDPTLVPVIVNTVRYTILVFVGVAVLARFGVQTTSIIAVLGAAGLAIGLALQGTLQNISAGIMLLIIRPLRSGDYIDADGIAGTVNEIGLFVTEMTTFDGVFVSVPNSQLWGRAIKNFTRNTTRRVDVPVGIAYDDNMDTAMEALLNLMKSDERVLPDPECQTMITELGDSAVVVTMRCWVHRDNYWGVLFDLNKRGKETVEAAGCSIPFPQRDVHLFATDADAKAKAS
jgi:small conductance mechanosensitive channel